MHVFVIGCESEIEIVNECKRLCVVWLVFEVRYVSFLAVWLLGFVGMKLEGV